MGSSHAESKGGSPRTLRQYKYTPTSENVNGQNEKNSENYRGAELSIFGDDFESSKHFITLFKSADASTIIHEISHKAVMPFFTS